MTFAILLASAILAVVAAAGVLRPFTRSGGSTVEPLADPLEDERLSLLRALKDLEDERSTAGISDETYRLLRAETEVRAVAVLRAMQARDGTVGVGEAELAELRASRRAASNGNGSGPPGASRRRVVAAVVVGAVAIGALIPILVHAVGSRSAGAPITGSVPTSGNPLSFFEQRVKDHPDDLAARLDLAERYLQSGNVQGAIAQYLEALRIDPEDPEARSTLGFLLFRAGRTQDGLRAVQQALAIDPRYPEALYYEGIIELQGMHRSDLARKAFRAYLQAAPFGSHVAEVRQYLHQNASPPPSPSPSS